MQALSLDRCRLKHLPCLVLLALSTNLKALQEYSLPVDFVISRRLIKRIFFEFYLLLFEIVLHFQERILSHLLFQMLLEVQQRHVKQFHRLI